MAKLSDLLPAEDLAQLNGLPLVCYALRAFEQAPSVREIVVVTRQDLLEPVSQLCKKHHFSKVTLIVCGGASRTASRA